MTPSFDTWTWRKCCYCNEIEMFTKTVGIKDSKIQYEIKISLTLIKFKTKMNQEPQKRQ